MIDMDKYSVSVDINAMRADALQLDEALNGKTEGAYCIGDGSEDSPLIVISTGIYKEHEWGYDANGEVNKPPMSEAWIPFSVRNGYQAPQGEAQTAYCNAHNVVLKPQQSSLGEKPNIVTRHFAEAGKPKPKPSAIEIERQAEQQQEDIRLSQENLDRVCAYYESLPSPHPAPLNNLSADSAIGASVKWWVK